MFERLDQAFEMEKQFTSDASHELRTPVAVILAQCELMMGEEKSPEEYQHALNVIERQSRKMSKLIQDLLMYTRLELKTDKYKKCNPFFHNYDPLTITLHPTDILSDPYQTRPEPENLHFSVQFQKASNC